MKALQVIAFILLLIIMYYSYISHADYYPSITNMLADPEKYDGDLVELQGIMADKTNSSFSILFGDQKIKVLYENPETPKLGYISVYGKFHREGFVEAYDIHLANYNSPKYIISFIGFIFFLFIFFKEWKLKGWRFESA